MSGWIEEIRWSLRVSSTGKLILVDHAIPEKLGPLVRALLADHPDLDVLTNVLDLPQVANGAVIVLLPRASDADWLNINRPLFARKALKVVLFCSREVSEALARQAPDFYDWISQRQECPAGVAEHAVFGIRAALRARAPGILFVLDRRHKNRVKHVEHIFQEALPGRQLLWLTPEATPYEDLVGQIRQAGRAWVACDARSKDVERLRWALAETARLTRVFVLLPEVVLPKGAPADLTVFEDRFWQLSDALWMPSDSLSQSVGEASLLLAQAGSKHPGRLAAVAGLEPAAVSSLIELLARDYCEETLLEAMLRSVDPGAGLAERILSAGIEQIPLQGRVMSAPVQRHLGKRIGLRRKFPGRPPRDVEGYTFRFRFPLLLGRASQIEWLLCGQRTRTPERWIELARLALDHGDPDAAATWAARALAMQESSEAYRSQGAALTELGRMARERGYPAAVQLQQVAERSLRRAEEMLDPSAPPKDVLAIYALRAQILLDLGLAGEAEWPLQQALRQVDEPAARVTDLVRVARALIRQGENDRAEKILSNALTKTTDPVELAEIRLDLGWVAMAQGHLDEADAIAAALADDKDPRLAAAPSRIRAGADSLHIRIRLARNQSQEALALADAALARPPLGLDADALPRIPLLAISLNRAGRARDAEVILRKLLQMPIEVDTNATALGLSSRLKVLLFLQLPFELHMEPAMRRELWDELVQALRSQGRHVEADEMEHWRHDESPLLKAGENRQDP